MSDVMEEGQIDRDAVARKRAELQAISWPNEGRVRLLVVTPEPHRHVTRDVVEVVAGKGFAEDHGRKSFYLGEHVPGREVTAISGEFLDVFEIDPVVVGDNLITEGIDLAALEEGDLLEAGEVLLERSDREHRPCVTFRRRTSPEAFAVASRDRLRGALFIVRRGGRLQRGETLQRAGRRKA